MLDDQQQPQAEPTQQTLSREGLVALYAEVGEQRHVIHELNARYAKLMQQHREFVGRLQAFEERHGDGRCIPMIGDSAGDREEGVG